MKSTAAGLAALGRGPDSMLVHMSPREVQGLQQLAMAHGGSLTTNPHTGLPEAGFLDNLLPTIIGAGLTIFSGGAINPMTAALITGGLQTARTGDLGKGIMAGLGAYGGAGLGGSLASLGASNAANQAVTSGIAENLGAVDQAISGAGQLPDVVAKTGAFPEVYGDGISAGLEKGVPAAYQESITYARPDNFASNPYTPEGVKYMQQQGLSLPDIKESAANYYNNLPASAFPGGSNAPVMGSQGLGDAYAGLKQTMQPGGLTQFGTELNKAFPTGMSKTAAGIGALGALGGFEQPQLRFGMPQQAPSTAKLSGPIRRPYDPERNLYTDYGILQPTYAAKGGEMHSVPQLEDGGFVLTKRAVDGMGKGSNERGQRAAAAGLGAIPIKGPGTGTSDSIPTSIDGVRPAKVSNGEAYVPRKRVKQAGGAKRLYALMRQAEQDAKRRAA